MVAKYEITIFAIGQRYSIEITEAEFSALSAAVVSLSNAVAIEQKFDLLVSNHIELEREIAERTLLLMYRGFQTTHDMLDDQLAFGQRLLNLLAAARMYVDHIKHHISEMNQGDQSGLEEAKRIFASQYDGSFAYRLMEALRNYSQHRGLPIHGFSYNQQYVQARGEPDRVEHNVRLSIDADLLQADRSFKRRVLDELKALPSDLDLKPLVREYIEKLAIAHVALRQSIDKRVSDATTLINDWRQRYIDESGVTDPLGLALISSGENMQMLHRKGLSDTPIVISNALRLEIAVMKDWRRWPLRPKAFRHGRNPSFEAEFSET